MNRHRYARYARMKIYKLFIEPRLKVLLGMSYWLATHLEETILRFFILNPLVQVLPLAIQITGLRPKSGILRILQYLRIIGQKSWQLWLQEHFIWGQPVLRSFWASKVTLEHTSYQIKQRSNVKLTAGVFFEKLIVAALTAQDRLDINQVLFDQIQHVIVIEFVVIIFYRQHVKLNACLFDHVYVLRLVGNVRRRIRDVLVHVDDFVTLFASR